MNLLRKINELKSKMISLPELDKTFVFPYSNDLFEKRKELWANLQKGLLLEDNRVFIHWETPFNCLNNYKEKRRDLGDRTEWYFGKHKILDGYESHPETMMWVYLPWTHPMTSVSENIGTDFDGFKNFIGLKEKLTHLFGEPSYIDLEEFGSLKLGEINWINGRVQISLIGIEHFNCRYSLRIGLIRDKNVEYLDEAIEKLKKQGLTEEELGK